MKFFNIPNYGMLSVDQILFEAWYPILFTCIDERDNLFICVCCQNNQDGKKWLINKTTADEVIQLLSNQLTIREMFTAHNDEKISINEICNTVSITFNSLDWNEDSPFLPKVGEYMDADEDEFEDEIEYFKEKKNSLYTKKYIASSDFQPDLDSNMDGCQVTVRFEESGVGYRTIIKSKEVTYKISQHNIPSYYGDYNGEQRTTLNMVDDAWYNNPTQSGLAA